MSWLRLVIASGILMGGCVGEELDLGETEQAAKVQPGEDGNCPPWACGSNSPEINFGAFHELNRFGQPNLEGFWISDFKKFENGAWQPYQPDVVNAMLVAKNSAGATVHTGSSVVGMVFTIKRGSLPNFVSTYYMRVAEFSRTPMWAKGPVGTAPTTPTYRFTWSTQPPTATTAGTQINLCGVNNEHDGVPDFQAVVYEADRIDSDSIRFVGEDAAWFNIGCAGHLIAKQHLTGNTKAAAVILSMAPTPTKMRTANLKMLSADYCGGGDPFTVAGTPLRWKDALGRMDNIPTVLTNIEARWNETGAICLNVPRVDYGWTLLGYQTFPNDVEPLLVGPRLGGKWCTGVAPAKLRPPPCTDPSLSNFQGGYLISVNQ